MKKIIFALLALALTGCDVHSHSNISCWYDADGSHWCSDGFMTWIEYDNRPPSTTVIYTSTETGGGYNNNIIVIEEEELWCSWEAPFYHEPDYCTFDGETCCTWQASLYGKWETYCYSDYCGWELVLVEEEYYSYQ